MARVPRKKSPGPDGIPPYLLYILPEESFTVINEVAKRIIKGEMDLAEAFESQTIAIHKGGDKDWRRGRHIPRGHAVGQERSTEML